MAAPQDDTATDLQAITAQLRAELSAALAEKEALTAERRLLAAELAAGKDAYMERINHQAATIDVLKAMSASPGDPQPVFEQIVEHAAALCDNASVALYEFDGSLVHLRAYIKGVVDDKAVAPYLALFPMAPTPASIACRAILEGRMIRISDIGSEPGLFQAVKDLGWKSQIALPFWRNGAVAGTINLNSREPDRFTDGQIALLETFGEQATIAITSAETYRALQARTTDLQEALDYQTATSDLLRIISRSTSDLDPVFEAVVSTAARLCRAEQAVLFRNREGAYRWAASYSNTPEYDRIERAAVIHPDQGTIVGRAALARQPVQILDAWTDPHYEAKDDARVGGARTILGVPLLRDGEPIGVIGLARRQVEPYTDGQVQLVSTFADQAVIAIENTRLLTEQREALEQQTATAEVLQVINTSPGNLTPIFDAILERAMRLCGAAFGSLYTLDGDYLVSVAQRGVPAAYAEFRARNTNRMRPGSSIAQAMAARRPNNLRDLMESEGYALGDPGVRAMVELGGIRSVLAVPLCIDDGVVGLISIYRQEVREFSAQQVTLLENFAAQAVIAMENARLIDEIRAARDNAETALVNLRLTQDRLIQTEKMASLGQLTAGIAHEIKNPLNFVNNFAALSVDLLGELKETAAPAFDTLNNNARADVEALTETLTGNLRKIEEHGKRADGIVRSMLEHSRASSGERWAVDLNALVDEALNLAYHGARAQDQSFTINLQRDFGAQIPPIEVSPQDITRVLLNLFSNGFYAATQRAKRGEEGFEPQLKVTTRAVADGIEIRVRDNGCGIPPDIRGKLFQPFFTTKPTGEGTGLGLSISYDIITKAHAGRITVDSEEGVFTEFVVDLPCKTFVG